MQEQEQTYKIVRFYFNQPGETIKTGLTLQQAQDWCNRQDTMGAEWFDGYEEEPKEQRFYITGRRTFIRKVVAEQPGYWRRQLKALGLRFDDVKNEWYAYSEDQRQAALEVLDNPPLD